MNYFYTVFYYLKIIYTPIESEQVSVEFDYQRVVLEQDGNSTVYTGIATLKEGKHKFFCVEDIRRPWHNETLRERCDVSKMVIHYTRNGLPKEIVLEGVWG